MSADFLRASSTFEVTPEPTPPINGAMVKGRAWHTCGGVLGRSASDDLRSGEYRCQECGNRGFLAYPQQEETS